jgi:hypothetical protein
MNERIKALAVEADFMLCEDGHFYSEGQSQKITDGLQKFAELILQDCMDVVDGYTKGRTFDTHYDAVAQIENLFGIKHNGVE